VGFVRARAHQDGPEDERAQRDSARVYEQPDYTSRLALHVRKSAAVDAFDFGVWIPNCEVVEEEHAVKGLGQELNLHLSRQIEFLPWLTRTHQNVACYQYS
jgi:hypothetical protein